MIKIQIHGVDEIIRTLNLIAAKTKDRTDLMRNIADKMDTAVLNNFDVVGRPAWVGIKYRKGIPLVDTENSKIALVSDEYCRFGMKNALVKDERHLGEFSWRI